MWTEYVRDFDTPVSYTHLDVYKRQTYMHAATAAKRFILIGTPFQMLTDTKYISFPEALNISRAMYRTASSRLQILLLHGSTP